MSSVTEILSSANDLLAAHSALVSRVRQSQKTRRALLRTLPSPPETLLNLTLIPDPPASPPESPPGTPPLPSHQVRHVRQDLPPAKRARAMHYINYVPEEETIRNDYSQRYVDGGEWPQDWVMGAEPERRFEEYPKQQRLLALKKASVLHWAAPPLYLPITSLQSLMPAKFDAILIDPPFSSSFTWTDLQELPIPTLAADPSFVFMWVGSGAGDGLEKGREVLAKWGYRRCEDVTWLKTNKTTNKGPGTDAPTTSLLTRTKQHCLIGIRGTVRRSTDSWFVHCNVDTDVMIWEGDPTDPTRKPPEMYTLIENFCLGLRRLELFGRASCLRRGWISALMMGEEEKVPAAMAMAHEERELPVVQSGPVLPAGLPQKPVAPALTNGFGEDVSVAAAQRWDRDAWDSRLAEWCQGERAVVPITPEIDQLRPKSPVRGGGGGGGVPPPPGSTPAPGAMIPPRPPTGMMTPAGTMGPTPGGMGGDMNMFGPNQQAMFAAPQPQQAAMGMGGMSMATPMGMEGMGGGGMRGMQGMGGPVAGGMAGGNMGGRPVNRNMGPRGGLNMQGFNMQPGFMPDGSGMMMGDGSMGMGMGIPGSMGGNMGGNMDGTMGGAMGGGPGMMGGGMNGGMNMGGQWGGF